MKMRFLAITPIVLMTTACIDRSFFESDPVQIRTSQGIVTCQLYTDNRIDWDEAIGRPETMTDAQAQAVCIAEGKKRLNQ